MRTFAAGPMMRPAANAQVKLKPPSCPRPGGSAASGGGLVLYLCLEGGEHRFKVGLVLLHHHSLDGLTHDWDLHDPLALCGHLGAAVGGFEHEPPRRLLCKEVDLRDDALTGDDLGVLDTALHL